MGGWDVLVGGGGWGGVGGSPCGIGLLFPHPQPQGSWSWIFQTPTPLGNTAPPPPPPPPTTPPPPHLSPAFYFSLHDNMGGLGPAQYNNCLEWERERERKEGRKEKDRVTEQDNEDWQFELSERLSLLQLIKTEREGGERDGSRREERNQKRYGEGRERKKKELEEIERKGNTMSAGIHSLQLQRKPVIFMIDTAS